MLPEIQTYIERLRALRGETLKTLDGVNAKGLNWKPTPKETNSMYALAAHLAGSERHWIQRVVGGRMIERDRDAEFAARGSDMSPFPTQFDEGARVSEEILVRLTDADLNATRETPNYGKVSARWAILHLLEHYSEHAGQMSLTRQVWENQAKSKKPKRKTGATRLKRGTKRKK